MTTTKQLNYIKDLSEVAEKGFKVGIYPDQIYIVPEVDPSPEFQPQIVDGDFYWKWIENAIDNGDIDFGDHTFGANLYFDLPHLLEKYGLCETVTSPAYIIYVLNDTVTMPNSVVDFESLKAWMQSEDFIDAINEVGYNYDEAMIRNDVAIYSPDDPADNIVLVNGELKLNTYIVCSQGEGEEIINATDPVGEPTLKVENLEVENVISENIKPWYSLFGTFDDDDDFTYTIVPYPTRKNDDNRYEGITVFIKGNSSERKSVFVDFENEKIYAEDGSTEIILGMAAVQLVNMLNGEIVQSLDI